MQSFFNYTTFVTKLEKSTRTLFITLNRPDWNNAFKLEMLFELEGLLVWCLNKVEINTICLQSSTSFFSSGLDVQALPKQTIKTLEKLNAKLQKVIFLMMQTPQTVVIDLGDGCETIASEFALGADIRICSEKAKIAFNHNHYGLVPAAGGMSLLRNLVSTSFAQSWVLSGKSISAAELTSSGLMSEIYHPQEKNQTLNKLLLSLAQSAPVPRIQSKLAMYEHLKEKLEKDVIKDNKIARAAMMAEDWRNGKYPLSKFFELKEENSLNSNQDSTFMPAKSMSYAVKLSLIKSENLNLDH